MSTVAVEQEIRALEDRRYQAMIEADAATLNELLADGLVYTHSSGRVETKAEFISFATAGKLRYRSFDRQEESIQMYGDTAVITGDVDIRLANGDEVIPLHVRHLNVWVKIGGRWQMVAWESTRLG